MHLKLLTIPQHRHMSLQHPFTNLLTHLLIRLPIHPLTHLLMILTTLLSRRAAISSRTAVFIPLMNHTSPQTLRVWLVTGSKNIALLAMKYQLKPTILQSTSQNLQRIQQPPMKKPLSMMNHLIRRQAIQNLPLIRRLLTTNSPIHPLPIWNLLPTVNLLLIHPQPTVNLILIHHLLTTNLSHIRPLPTTNQNLIH